MLPTTQGHFQEQLSAGYGSCVWGLGRTLASHGDTVLLESECPHKLDSEMRSGPAASCAYAELR